MNEIKFPINPIVGEYYIVPHIRLIDGNMVPINSHLHQDVKVIGFAEMHWHIDWRFMSPREWVNTRSDITSDSMTQAKWVVILLPDGAECYSRFITKSDRMVYLKKKCHRQYATGSFHEDNKKAAAKWPRQLQKKFVCSSLKEIDDQLICPHKGIAIDKNCKDVEGNYVCPGHLLRFDPQTLKAVQ